MTISGIPRHLPVGIKRLLAKKSKQNRESTEGYSKSRENHGTFWEMGQSEQMQVQKRRRDQMSRKGLQASPNVRQHPFQMLH